MYIEAERKTNDNEISYYNQLVKFLNQAQTDGLAVNGYQNIYNGLRVRVSFGQGNPARVPWIAFLDSTGVNQVSNGIYPVYLYYKSRGILILAYGVSETNRPA